MQVRRRIEALFISIFLQFEIIYSMLSTFLKPSSTSNFKGSSIHFRALQSPLQSPFNRPFNCASRMVRSSFNRPFNRPFNPPFNRTSKTIQGHFKSSRSCGLVLKLSHFLKDRFIRLRSRPRRQRTTCMLVSFYNSRSC